MAIDKELIQRIVDAEFELQRFVEDEPAQPIPGTPAPASELARLDQHLARDGLACPPSYREFLEVCNGIKGFKSGFSLLPIDGVIKPAPDTFKRRYPALARFMVGRGESLEFIALNPERAVGAELEVVSVADDGNESRYPSFGQYLQARLGQLQRAVDLQRADRKRKKR